ncbi:MAG: potassium transporter Kup [Gemmatimonadetes bacterium]|nr:potassium transporter Kup [Gemmatimonadota bacterium]
MTAEVPAAPQRHHAEADPHGKRLAILAFTALGVVYGDIGTSPLYAVQDAFKSVYGLTAAPDRVYGLLSLIVWSLVLIVTVKYVGFILRADNKGEGGVYALLALILRSERKSGRGGRTALIMLGLFGGAFLYGDGIITPAISVVGAMEGLKVLNPAFEHLVVPFTFVIIATLFYFQYHGTARIGGLFGWIMLAWFSSIAVLGIRGILMHPEIFAALNPMYAVHFFTGDPVKSFVVLGAVVLVVTGGEALYADMGHFGRKPIRMAWLGLVLPALLLNYFGQGALILADVAAAKNPFYLLAPSWWLVPQIIISTLAAIVASQALISGAFSLTQQAVQLGYSPRVTIVHTSKEEAGQIYIPEINVALAIGTLALVVMAGSVEELGQMYGVAVTGTMVITNLLFVSVARERFGWSRGKCLAFLAGFMVIDLTFFTANLLKVPTGGWVPLAIATAVFALMTTWKRGRELLRQFMTRNSLPIEEFVRSLKTSKVTRVPGTAIFMTSESEGTPVVLLHHLKHNKVLHEQVILLSVISREVPEVPSTDRIRLESLSEGVHRVRALYGFMEQPNVEDIRARLAEAGIRTKKMDTTYYLGREQLIATSNEGMVKWRKRLFAIMSRNARSATQYFSIPPNRVVELGAQIEF